MAWVHYLNLPGDFCFLVLVEDVVAPVAGTVEFKDRAVANDAVNGRDLFPATVPRNGPLSNSGILRLAKKIHNEAMTVLTPEENVKQTLALCDHAYGLENETIVLEGKGKKLAENEDVKSSFLGV